MGTGKKKNTPAGSGAGAKKAKTYLKDTKSKVKGQGADFTDVEFEVVEEGQQQEDQAAWADRYKPVSEKTDEEWTEDTKKDREKNKEKLETEEKKEEFLKSIISDIENLTEIEYERDRKDIAKKHGVRVRWVDTIYGQLHPGKNDKGPSAGVPIVFEEPEPWAEAVDGSNLLSEISSTIKRFLILPDEGADIMALYVVFTYIFKEFGICPLLIFLSAIMRSGKTLAETIMSFLCNKSIAVSNISEAVLYRVVTRDEPTLIMDELDALFGQKKSDKSEATRALLNSGQTISTAFVLRCNPQTFEPEMFSTYCPKICAAIKTLPATIMDRGFVLHLVRKKPNEKVERFSKVKPDPVFKILRSKIQRWVNDSRDQIKNIEPALPPGLSDREVDNWEPLLAIAEAVGSKWITRGSKAALFLSAKSAEEGEAAIMLLEDVHNYFSNYKTDRVSSKDLADHLGELEVRPWPEWRKEKPISPRQIASILKPFNIAPSPIRINGLPTKGYDRKNFIDAWGRYLNGYAVTEVNIR